MNFWIFIFGCLLSLPKQFDLVYLGYAMTDSGNQTTGSKVLKLLMIGCATALAIGAFVYIKRKMTPVRPTVEAQMRDRRYRFLVEARTLDPISNPKIDLDEVDPEGKASEVPKPDSVKQRIKLALVDTRGKQPVLPTTNPESEALTASMATPDPYSPIPLPAATLPSSQTPAPTADMVVRTSPELQTDRILTYSNEGTRDLRDHQLA